MITIKAIAFTAYPVTDITRARAFYEGVLGLKTGVTFQHENGHWIEYDLGPATLAISNLSADQWKPSSDGPSAALEVEHFDEGVAHLRAHGVRFVLEPMDSGVCRMAIIADPDGNSLAIHHRAS
jgi:catechol 2,3-dioxygenase-like lactoylglutathione lyase family enzyme